MAYNTKAKLKVFYLLKILQEQTDAERGLTMPQIIEQLAAYGISAERKSVYDDIRALREFDIDVTVRRHRPVEYAIEGHDFTLNGLMLMIDAIQSCRSLTTRQAKMLVTNVRQLVSNHEQELLDRRIHVEGRIRSARQSVFPMVDLIHEAWRLRCKISFGYWRIGADGKSHDVWEGASRVITPMGVSYDEGFYYLTVFDESHARISEYRLDRMVRLCLLTGEMASRNADIAHWRARRGEAARFGRFAGEEVAVTLAVRSDRAEIVADRFGEAAKFFAADSGDEARAEVRVCKSEQFFGWVAGMGKTVRIAAPESLVAEYRNYLQYLLED